MKRILLCLLIVLVVSPIACAAICDIKIENGEDGTCGNYMIRHDSWSSGDHHNYQTAHFSLWRLSPSTYLGSSSIDFYYESDGKYYDDDKLHIRYTGSSAGPPRKAKYTVEDLTPQLGVKGNLKYKGRNLAWAPAKWATVHIWEHDPGIGDDDCLGSALTDETGYFEFGPVMNVDSDDDGGKMDILVNFVASSSVGSVRDVNDSVYNLWEGTYHDVDELNEQWQISDNETQYKAWWVYDTLCDGWGYLSDTVGYEMTGVTVYWQWNHTAEFFKGFGECTAAYPWGVGTPEHPLGHPFIFLDGRRVCGDDGGHANDPDTIIHEYGHCVMYKVFGDYYPPDDCSDGHWMTGVSEPVCAWCEGWAHFMSLAVFDDNYFTDTTYCTGPSGCGVDAANLETRNGNLNFPDGDSCEGNVAAALWDIYDDHDEMYDRLSDGFDNIWHVLQEHDQTGNEDTLSSRAHSAPLSGVIAPRLLCAPSQNRT